MLNHFQCVESVPRERGKGGGRGLFEHSFTPASLLSLVTICFVLYRLRGIPQAVALYAMARDQWIACSFRIRTQLG